jgi:hypothetical protein
MISFFFLYDLCIKENQRAENGFPCSFFFRTIKCGKDLQRESFGGLVERGTIGQHQV